MKSLPKHVEVRYLNRELSWLEFNRRVLEEAADPQNPLLERLKFLAIFESNLDEFYMVRVSGLIEQFESGVLDQTPDGLTPNEQLIRICKTAEPLRYRASQIFQQQIRPQLEKSGIYLRDYKELSDKQKEELKAFFEREVFPLCTPVILYPAPTVPFISNRSLNLAVELLDSSDEIRLARVKIPTVIPRAVRLNGKKHEFVLLDEVITANLQAFFPGVEIVGSYAFRVVRDADVEIMEIEAADLISTIEETIRLRRFGAPVLLQHEPTMSLRVHRLLMTALDLDEEDVFAVPGPLGFEVFWEIVKIDKPSLRYPPHVPYLHDSLATANAIFETVSSQDVLLHHPYDSFRTVEEFVGAAAKDPHVMGIKQTLYRVGSESPIVQSLLDAAEAGKQVAVMVELKARFDESNNLVWARALERVGVHVAYGFAEMKTHCKLCLVVRREQSGVKQYVHIGTGNYNPATARIYTDLGLITCDKDIVKDVSELFNFLTGYSRQTRFRKLLVAPVNLREGIVDRIRRETIQHRESGRGRIFFKLNSLVDPEVIDALYEASQAGVSIDLVVRGVCCLRPGVAGLSENIRVVSIVGRFLEHSRIYYFFNEGDPDVLIGSADAMRRNLDRRVEVLVPIQSPKLVQHIHDHLLLPCLRDNVKAWHLIADGSYQKSCPPNSEEGFQLQSFFMDNPTSRYLFDSQTKPHMTRRG